MSPESEAKREATPAYLSEQDITSMVLRQHGIDFEAERTAIIEREKEAGKEAQRLQFEQEQREAERLRILDTARQLIKSGNLLIKIDKKPSTDVSVPCPFCGSSIVEASLTVWEFAHQVGPDVVKYVSESGRPPFHMNAYACRNCSRLVPVSIQVII